MQVHLKLYGALASASGVRSLFLTLVAGSAVSDLLDSLVTAHPVLGSYMPDPGHELTDFLLVVRGKDEISLTTLLADGDEIILALPMSGGAH